MLLSPVMLLGPKPFGVHLHKWVCGHSPGTLGFMPKHGYTPPRRLHEVRVDVDVSLEELLVTKGCNPFLIIFKVLFAIDKTMHLKPWSLELLERTVSLTLNLS